MTKEAKCFLGCSKCDGCKSLPLNYKSPKPKRNTKCCRCGRTYAELKVHGIGLEEMKDVIGGDDWAWWCDNCLIKMLGEECNICHTVTRYAVKCPKCNTILCLVCAKGHNCGILNRIKRFFKECLESNAKLYGYEYSPWMRSHYK